MNCFWNGSAATKLLGVDFNNNLISFDSAAPATTLSSVAITGMGGASVLAMDYRVFDNLLYVLADNKQAYTVNQSTGVATSFQNFSALTGSQFAFDFNPTNTNLRIVSNDNTNYVYSFATNTLNLGTNVAYTVGGPTGGTVSAGAYLNNDNDSMTGTVLYVIDSANDLLATQNPANGQLTPIGSLGVDFQTRSSFDIFTVGTTNSAFAYTGTSLYSINLSTGAATAIGATDRQIFALAAVPGAAVPEPATWLSMIFGFGLVGGVMRKKLGKFVTA